MINKPQSLSNETHERTNLLNHHFCEFSVCLLEDVGYLY